MEIDVVFFSTISFVKRNISTANSTTANTFTSSNVEPIEWSSCLDTFVRSAMVISVATYFSSISSVSLEKYPL